MNGIWSEFVTAKNGTFVVNDFGVEKVQNAWGLYASAGTIFSRIEINGDTGTDVKDDVVQDSATALLSDCILTLPEGQYFSAITISAGQVVLIKK